MVLKLLVLFTVVLLSIALLLIGVCCDGVSTISLISLGDVLRLVMVMFLSKLFLLVVSIELFCFEVVFVLVSV